MAQMARAQRQQHQHRTHRFRLARRGTPKALGAKGRLRVRQPDRDGCEKSIFSTRPARNDTLTAFDAGSGKPLWSQAYTCGTKADRVNNKNPDNDLPVVLATPTIDHGKIFSYGAGGDLVCRKLEDGSQLWAINILHTLNSKILGWAQASSPLVTDKYVYVQSGDGGPTAVAVDRENREDRLEIRSTNLRRLRGARAD